MHFSFSFFSSVQRYLIVYVYCVYLSFKIYVFIISLSFFLFLLLLMSSIDILRDRIIINLESKVDVIVTSFDGVRCKTELTQ